MADTGWTSPASVAEINIGAGVVSWSGTLVAEILTGTLIDNTTGAYVEAGAGDITEALRFRNFAWATPIPSSGITLSGIETRCRCYGSAGHDFIYNYHRLVLSAALIGTDQSVATEIGTTASFQVIGSSIDLHGWAANKTDLDDSSFGFQIAFEDDASGADEMYVEFFQAKVHWTVEPPAGPTVPTATGNFHTLFN